MLRREAAYFRPTVPTPPPPTTTGTLYNGGAHVS